MMRSFFFLLSFSSLCFANPKVIFLELRKSNGEVLFLESGFSCAHVGIKIGEEVFHAYPNRGSEKISLKEFTKIGRIAATFEIFISEEKLVERLTSLLGKFYDTSYSWSDAQMYCSELVAKALGIPPSPMHFDSTIWPEQYLKLEGKPGISPSKVFNQLQEKQIIPISGCYPTLPSQ